MIVELNIGFANILFYMLVWVRLAGMFLFNPLLSRSNVPARVRMGLVFFLAILLGPLQPQSLVQAVYEMSGFAFTLAIIQELAIGLVYGFVFQIFYYFLYTAGDYMDTEFGLSMAKTFDPATNIQTAISSRLITTVFVLYIFVSGSHLALIRMFASSFEAIPVGTFTLSTSIVTFILQLFTQVFALAIRLVAPFMVAEFILQASMGVLMKFIPQITVFVINFQLRIILGLLMLILFTPYIGQFVDNYIDTLFDSLVAATSAMTGG